MGGWYVRFGDTRKIATYGRAIHLVHLVQSKYPGDQAGAEYGTGYCDAQCPQDIKFINGQVGNTTFFYFDERQVPVNPPPHPPFLRRTF